MSGYCEVCGWMELTPKKARFWSRGESVRRLGVSGALFEAGLEFFETRCGWVIHAHPYRIWEVLSGQPTDSNHYVGINSACYVCSGRYAKYLNPMG